MGGEAEGAGAGTRARSGAGRRAVAPGRARAPLTAPERPDPRRNTAPAPPARGVAPAWARHGVPMTTWARRGTPDNGRKTIPRARSGPGSRPAVRDAIGEIPKNDGCESSAVSFRVGARRTAGGRVRRAPGPRPSRANRAPAEATTARMLFVNFCRKWYGQAGDRKAHLSACSASLALYTRSARERPVRSSVKLFILRSRRTAGRTKPEPRRCSI